MVQLSNLLDDQSINDENFAKILTEWNTQNARNFTFPDVGYTQRKPIFAAIFAKLASSRSNEQVTISGLTAIRILSREKMALDECFSNENDIFLIFQFANLGDEKIEPTISSRVRIEALKCLCNVIYNCPAVQIFCKNGEIVKSLVANLKQGEQGDIQVTLLSCKILFLVTGFNASMRPVAFGNGAVEAISAFLTPKLIEKTKLNSELSECLIEALKAVFNVASSADCLDDKNRPVFDALTDLLRKILLIESDRFEEICFQSLALMTLLPQPCFARLILDEAENESDDDSTKMTAIQRVLDHFDYVLTNQANSEHLVPIFVALTRMSRSNRLIRRFFRSRVLPPLHESDVRRLPQEGSTIRNKICRLLTSTSVDLKEHAADLLFVLCKENVHRFIKYTGFGNAAGLLANHGLLGRVAGRGANQNGEEYSEESGKSDTEDYRQIRDEINPVTGRVDPPVAKNPFEGMSDEQKEYEAMQLVNAIDRLQRQGLMEPIQLAGPRTLGSSSSNNHSAPVEHVLQLRDEFLKQNGIEDDDDSGDD